MAATRVDSEVGECRVMSATAAELSRSPNEAREVVQSWTGHNYRIDYVDEPPLSRSRTRERDRLSKYSDSCHGSLSHDVQDDEERSQQEEKLFPEKEICIVDRISNVNGDTRCDKTDSNVDNDIVSERKIIARKGGNESLGNSKGKLETTRASPPNSEVEGKRKLLNNRNRGRKTTLENENHVEQEKRAIHGIKIATSPSNKRINNAFESARSSPDTDKTIGSGERERTRNIESHKDDSDEDKAGLPMEISSPRSRAYPHGDDVVVSAVVTPTSADSPRAGDLRCETAIRKVVHSAEDSSRARSPGKTRRFAPAKNAVVDRDSGDNRGTTDVIVVAAAVAEEKRKDNTEKCEKCENCGESHFSYSRYAQLWKYSGYVNRDANTVFGERQRDVAAKLAADRGIDSRLAETPVTTAAMLYRSRSLPRLSVHDSGVACSDHAPAPGPTHAASRQLVAELRQLLTLKQHYYPEGGWGWVVLLVGLLVQILSHGAHGAVGVFLQQVAAKFGSHVHLQAG